MRKRNTITLKWLEKEGASGAAIRAFYDGFGRSAPTGIVLRAMFRSPSITLKTQVNWSDWVLKRCLPTTLNQERYAAWWAKGGSDAALKRVELKFINKAWPKEKP